MDDSDFQDPTEFASQSEELEYWRNAAYSARDLYYDSQIEIESVKKQIVDLSVEYEKDIKLLEKANSQMRNEIEVLKSSVEDWREKYRKARHQTEESLTKTERELQFLKSQQEFYKTRTRELEQDNDDLEKSERAIKSSLFDAEAKIKGLSKTNEGLANEIKSKNLLVEEVQRLKDELNANMMERMRGLESTLENARSRVVPLINQTNRDANNNTSELRSNLRSPRLSGIGLPNHSLSKSNSVHVYRESSRPSNMKEPTQFNSGLARPTQLGNGTVNFAASSELSRMRMARAKAIRNGPKSNLISAPGPEENHKIQF
ncbi:hypothetical protein BB560_004877 [Smittium megazygosporum]|uniref:NUDE domain-containing protein n=1 Tax=Smittium megazygosporum TaxID=133381 RepID=A0A2T9Z803_9FUNG|nr:hypothetical protein BB560_004877 [Smittium megazygosporum]